MPTVLKSHEAKLKQTTAAILDQKVDATVIEKVPVASLKSNPKNAKKHPQQQILLLAENFKKFGMHQPIVIDETNTVLAGHARLEAAKLLNLHALPAIRLNGLSAHEKRAVALADNKLSELGEWNPDILRAELKELVIDAPELDFDYSIMGFDTVAIDQILADGESDDEPDAADITPRVNADQFSTVATGDVWTCGDHILCCGDALDPAPYRAILVGSRAQVVFTDPPYNVPNSGHVTKRAGVREFAMASGDLSAEQFTDFLQTVVALMVPNVADGAVIYVCMDWRHLDELSAATRHYLGKPKNMIVWVKTNGGQGTFYRSQHEHIAVFVAGNAAPTNNFRLGERGRYRTNVWRYPGFNSFGRDRDAALASHPTVKPVALVVDALRDCSKRGDIVLDPFGGSGTTMIAAERTGRSARLIEIDPIFCEVILQRWQKFSGKEARLLETNETFAQVQLRRSQAEAFTQETP